MRNKLNFFCLVVDTKVVDFEHFVHSGKSGCFFGAVDVYTLPILISCVQVDSLQSVSDGERIVRLSAVLVLNANM